MIWTHVAAAVLAAGLAFSAGWKVRDWAADQKAAEVQAVIATEREAAMHAALIETTRRLDAQKGITDAARKRTAAAQADRDAAAATAGSLRERADQLAARAGACDPAAADGGAAKRLADVLAASIERYREVAAAADRAVIAGQLCEQSYQSLVP